MWPAWLALALLCAALFTVTAPGRITYPDDEIVFQTTQSLVEHGTLAIPGIPKRTGERPDRPSGSFGWAPGDPSRHHAGERFGFFGHGLSWVATPIYALAKAAVARVPERWRYAIRSDLFTFHKRGLEADWLRMVVSLTNCLLTPLSAVLLGMWLMVLGYESRAAVATALLYALGTTAWPYSGMLLSEPLSALVLLGASLEISRWQRDGGRAHLWAAAALAGFGVHVHLLNLLALPCLGAYALAPSWRANEATGGIGARISATLRAAADDRVWWGALAIGALALALLGLDQWARFGSPFESGRYDHYGHWVWPWRGLLTMAIAPGRSLLWYSPPLLAGLWCWPALRRRDPATAWLLVALLALRAVFVACRSDWHGGWALGPRYLVPMVPFMMIPVAGLIERAGRARVWQRALGFGAALACVLFQAWLALHSIFQVLWAINHEHGPDRYWAVVDWELSALPPLAFWRLQAPALGYARDGNWSAARSLAQFDALGFGAWRLSAVSDADGLWWVLEAIAGVGVLAGVSLWLWFWAERRT